MTDKMSKTVIVALVIIVMIISILLVIDFFFDHHRLLSPVSPFDADVMPDEVAKQIRTGQISVSVENGITRHAVKLTRVQQEELASYLFTDSNWKRIPVSATAPTIIISILPTNHFFTMDRSYVYPGSRLDIGIPVENNALLTTISNSIK